MIRLFISFLRKDINVFFIKNNNSYIIFFFYLVLLILFSMGIGPNLDLLSDISISILWNSFFVALILSIDLFFFRDYDNKSINNIKLRPKTLPLYFLSKAFSHWLINTFPIVLNIPMFLILLNINLELIYIILPVFIVSSASLSLLGLLSSVLISSLKQKGTLISFIIMPIYIPNLIFSIDIINKYINNSPFLHSSLFLVVNLLIFITVIPIVSTYIIKNHHY